MVLCDNVLQLENLAENITLSIVKRNTCMQSSITVTEWAYLRLGVQLKHSLIPVKDLLEGGGLVQDFTVEGTLLQRSKRLGKSVYLLMHMYNYTSFLHKKQVYGGYPKNMFTDLIAPSNINLAPVSC